MPITRKDIINAIWDGLRIRRYIHAAWLEGSDAHGVNDEYSDIDLWIDVDDGRESEALDLLKSTLTSFGPLDLDFEPQHPHPQIRQAYYHISGTSEFIIIDVCVQSHSREIYFQKGFVDQKIYVLFDGFSTLKFKDPDWTAFEHENQLRCKEIISSLPLGVLRTRKEIQRKNYLEALSYYQHEILEPLVELLRLKYQPTKHDFKLKHITRDLPKNVLIKLEYLFSISSIEDISEKYPEAETMIRETAAGMTHNA